MINIKDEENKKKFLLEKWKDKIPEDWEEKNKNERRKYLELYVESEKYKKERDPKGYGRGNHGMPMINYLKNLKPNSIVDVGCGFGNFCHMATDFIPEVFGVDIASVKTNNVIENKKIKFIDSDALNLNLPDKSVDYVVSFDCLEHCLEEDIDLIIKNFARIAKKGFIFSIAYRQAGERSNHGELLHMTVKPETWWLNIIEKYAVLVHKEGSYYKEGSKYLCFELK
jgi:SAM-dependent methyltransferase